MEDISFGRWLSQRRKALGFTQEALGAQVGVARATIRKIEADERRPSKEIAEGLATALNVAADDVPTFIRFARGESSRHVPVRSSLPQPPAPWQPQRPPTNLPLSSTALLGRTHEVAAVTDQLRRPAVRLVTLIGPGGIGKTRLSLQIAEELCSQFADGVWLVALGPLRDPALVLPAIAQTLGLKELGEQPLLEIVQTFLRDKQLLLVLDNFEHLLPAASMLASLLANSAGLRVLATSRAPLHLMAEHEFPVPPLSLPDLHCLPTLEILEQNDAIALFIQRTQAVKPDFRLTTATSAAVAEICVRLDGLPLAIELAAARSKLLPPAVLLARLSHRLAMLTGGRQDMPERHQTLRHTIDWSYQLLCREGQQLFRQLAVFAGGGTLEAVEVICQIDKEVPNDPFEGLTSLVDNSLLLSSEWNDEPRFTMLETIREYAVERFQESTEVDEVRRRHATYFLSLAEQAEAELTGSHQAVWLRRLAAEHDNLRVVLQWALEQQAVEAGLRLASAIWRFWLMHGYVSEGRQWLKTFLESQTGMSTVSPTFRAKALQSIGNLAAYQGDYAGARAYYEESLSLRRKLEDKQGIAALLSNLAIVARNQQELEVAQSLNEESLCLRRELGDTWGVSISLGSLGILAMYARDYDAAFGFFIESITLQRTLGDKHCIAISLNNLGNVALYRGEPEAARVYNEESLHIRRELGDKPGMCDCLEGLAGVAADEQRPERAARLFGAAAALREALGVPVPPGEEVVFARRAAARGQVSEQVWTAAWAEGQAMSVEQAVAYALASDS